MTIRMSNEDIAERLNARARTVVHPHMRIVISRSGLQDEYSPSVEPGLFYGEALVEIKRGDGVPWTAGLVAAELANDGRGDAKAEQRELARIERDGI